MQRKKGFIFIETLVVIAVLTISLMLTYSSYSGTIIKEKTRIRYNDSAFMYRTFYLAQFFRNFRLDLVAKSNEHTEFGFSGFGCSNGEIFINQEKYENEGFCEKLFNKYRVNHIYLADNNLSEIQDCHNFEGKCEILAQVSEDTANYLKTIGGFGKSGYRIIVEYSEDKNGKKCDYNGSGEDKCIYYYNTISLGEI